jgi:hypothetical protein
MPKLPVKRENKHVVGDDGNDYSHWVDKKINLLFYRMRVDKPNEIDENEPFTETVDAKCHGTFGVIKTLRLEQNHYELIFVPDSAILIKADKEKDAMRFGDVLWNYYGSIFRTDKWDEVKARIPQWVIRWGKACNATKMFLDPAPYQVEE